jgi:hypothetical protein
MKLINTNDVKSKNEKNTIKTQVMKIRMIRTTYQTQMMEKIIPVNFAPTYLVFKTQLMKNIIQK